MIVTLAQHLSESKLQQRWQPTFYIVCTELLWMTVSKRLYMAKFFFLDLVFL